MAGWICYSCCFTAIDNLITWTVIVRRLQYWWKRRPGRNWEISQFVQKTLTGLVIQAAESPVHHSLMPNGLGMTAKRMLRCMMLTISLLVTEVLQMGRYLLKLLPAHSHAREGAAGFQYSRAFYGVFHNIAAKIWKTNLWESGDSDGLGSSLA